MVEYISCFSLLPRRKTTRRINQVPSASLSAAKYQNVQAHFLIDHGIAVCPWVHHNRLNYHFGDQMFYKTGIYFNQVNP
jgi:hypothetical protein